MFFDSIYYIFFFFFFSSQNFKRGGALAPSMDAPPLLPAPILICTFIKNKVIL